MTTTAQYATIPKNGVAQISTANANKDGTGVLGVVLQAGPTGQRVDGLSLQSIMATTAGMLRFYLTKGRPLGVILSLTFAGTTATVTTAVAHGLTTSQLIGIIGCYPDEYNVTDVAITVTGATTFSYLMTVAPTANATVLGSGASSLAVPVTRMFLEVPVTAVTPSSSTVGFAATVNASSASNYFPLVLQSGWSLRVSTEKAETFNVIPLFAGDFS